MVYTSTALTGFILFWLSEFNLTKISFTQKYKPQESWSNKNHSQKLPSYCICSAPGSRLLLTNLVIFYSYLCNFNLKSEVIADQKPLLVDEFNRFAVIGLLNLHKGISPSHVADFFSNERTRLIY